MTRTTLTPTISEIREKMGQDWLRDKRIEFGLRYEVEKAKGNIPGLGRDEYVNMHIRHAYSKERKEEVAA